MVHFMCLSQSPEIDVVGLVEPLEALVNKNIVHHKIGDAIQRDADSDVKHEAVSFHEVPDTEKYHRYTSENDEEVVVLLKKVRKLIVVILMQVPEQTVHDVLVRKPGHTFHYTERDDDNTNI